MTMSELTIISPDDWHLHVRDFEMLRTVVPYTSRIFRRAIIMPNLVPPIVSCAEAEAYRQRILEAVPEGETFEPLMTLYLTENMTTEEIRKGVVSGVVSAVKLYPAGVTTNSESGVRDLEKTIPVLETMAELGVPLLLHGEVTDPGVDIFDREAVFIDTVLDPLRARLPELRIILEHITTTAGVDYVREAEKNLAATITLHHLIINRNAIFSKGFRPHYYCLPIAKREEHRQALLAAAVSDDPRFFFGSDSAPHLDSAKESSCGCAGIFTAACALECLAAVFEQEGKLDRLERFVSVHGARFYGLPRNDSRIRLVKRKHPLKIPEKIVSKEGNVTSFDPSFPIYWQVEYNRSSQ